jgi:hypothetical protein
LRLLDDLPGIGPWTAGVILLRGFGWLDVFPPGDVGARRTLAHLLGRTSPIADADETELLERLGPYRRPARWSADVAPHRHDCTGQGAPGERLRPRQTVVTPRVGATRG